MIVFAVVRHIEYADPSVISLHRTKSLAENKIILYTERDSKTLMQNEEYYILTHTDKDKEPLDITIDFLWEHSLHEIWYNIREMEIEQ